MSENIENKIELKDKLISYYNKNKIIFLIFFLIILIASTIFIFIEKNYEKKNILISEKYIQAGLLLSSGNIEISKNIYEEIILSENKFYSVLALNAILEKNLENDKNKILNYFKILENIKKSEEMLDLITFKKALYLIKTSDAKNGNDLLKKLIDKNSKLKSISQEIIVK
jgi:hypothetical protein